jgi:hypothetical protein
MLDNTGEMNGNEDVTSAAAASFVVTGKSVQPRTIIIKDCCSPRPRGAEMIDEKISFGGVITREKRQIINKTHVNALREGHV